MQLKMGDDCEEKAPETVVKVTPSVLDAFDLLRATKDDEKLNGGVKIIFQLQNSENEKDVRYVLKRLVRSLGANVPDMRTGYFATLVTVLTKLSQITVSTLLGLIKKELHANKSSKSEVGDVALGHILVCGAIFRSGRMLQCSEDEQKEVMQLLLNASKKKSYLSTVTYLILLDFIKGLNEEQFSSIVWSNITVEFKNDLKEHSLDSLYFLMIAYSKFPSKVKLRKLIGVTEVLCEDNIHMICEKIMTGIDFNSVSHPIYKEIGTQIANSPQLKLFWTSGIDSQLVKHNRNRELAAINLLSTILSNMKENHDVIPELISTNMFKLLMDWFKGLQTASKIRNKRDDEDDHKIMIKKAKELLNSLAKLVKSEKVTNATRVATLNKLLFNPGEINFAEVTGTSIIKSIISDLEKDGVKKMAKLFKGVLLNTTKKFVKENVERSWYNNERVRAAELLSHLVSHEAVKDDTEFKLTYMKLLMCFGFFKIGGDNIVAISFDLSASIKSCFYRCFTSRFSNVDSLVSVLSSLCNFVCSILEKEEVKKKLEKQFPTESMECWQVLTQICQNIEQNESTSKVDKVFLILFYQLGLFLFSEPTHVKVSRSSIKELKSCYEHYRKGRKKKPGKKIKDDTNEEPEWIEVLVEVLLSILSVESSVLRSVVQCVFRLLWEFLTPTAVGQIISVLDPESESNPLTQDDDSEEDSDDEDDEKEEESSDKHEDGSDDSNSEIEEDEDEEMKIPEQLRMAVQKALGSAVPESDTESVDADMIDEEEGKKLDEALTEAFKQFQSGKSKGKKNKKERKDKKALSDFRIRVLDLIDIYLEKDPSMDICLSMIAPLMRSLEFCMRDNQFSELENRVRKTIKTLTKIRKFASTEGVSLDVLCDYLKSTIDKGERSHFVFQAVGDVVTYFAIFIIHCSQKLENKVPVSPKKKKNKSPLVEILKDALQSYFKNRNCLLPIIFFHNVLQTEWEGSYDLAPIVIDNIFNTEVRQFRRNEGLELLAGFYRALKRNKPDDRAVTKLTDLETKFENTLEKTLKDGEFEAKNNYFVQLKKLINVIRMFHESCHVVSKLDFKSLLDTVGSCKGTNKIKGKPPTPMVQTENGKPQKTKKNKKKRKQQMNGHAEPKAKKVRKDSHQSE